MEQDKTIPISQPLTARTTKSTPDVNTSRSLLPVSNVEEGSISERPVGGPSYAHHQFPPVIHQEITPHGASSHLPFVSPSSAITPLNTFQLQYVFISQNPAKQVPIQDPLTSALQTNRNPAPNSKGPGKKAAKPKQKQQKTVTKRRLTDDDHLTIINYWKEKYETYCKSQKKAFAKRASIELNRSYFSQKGDSIPVTAEQLERKFQYWVDRYKEVAKCFKDSGFGLTADDPSTLKEEAERKLKHFWELHSFLASRANINPPYLLQLQRENQSTHLEIDEEYGKLPVDMSGTNKTVENKAEERERCEEDKSEDERVEEVETTTTRNEKSESHALGSRGKRRRSLISGEEGTKERRVPDGVGGTRSPERNALGEIEDASPVGEGVVETGSKGKAKTASHGRSQKNQSSGREKNAENLLASQVTQNEVQNEMFFNVMEHEKSFREQEMTLLQRTATYQEQRANLLQREEQRKDRAEERLEREDQRQHEAAQREKEISERQMKMDEAEQLRKQATAYKDLDMPDEALESMKKAEKILSKLSDIRRR